MLYLLHLLKEERWVSGLNQQFAKLPYVLFSYRGFESPPLRSLCAILRWGKISFSVRLQAGLRLRERVAFALQLLIGCSKVASVTNRHVQKLNADKYFSI